MGLRQNNRKGVTFVKKTVTRKQLMRVLETLPEYQVPLVFAYIEALHKGIEEEMKRMKADIIYQNMQTSPEEDYELSEEEQQRIERGRKQIREGKSHKWEDVAKELRI
jgi:hypothetical protein